MNSRGAASPAATAAKPPLATLNQTASRNRNAATRNRLLSAEQPANQSDFGGARRMRSRLASDAAQHRVQGGCVKVVRRLLSRQDGEMGSQHAPRESSNGPNEMLFNMPRLSDFQFALLLFFDRHQQRLRRIFSERHDPSEGRMTTLKTR